jgi:hypothetical protein
VDIKYGNGRTKYGPGVSITLTGTEVARAISAWIVAQGVHVDGSRTITINGEMCEVGNIYVDPSGFVVKDGEKMSGRGPTPQEEEPAQAPDWSHER